MDTWAIQAAAVLAFAVTMVMRQLDPLRPPPVKVRSKKRVNARASRALAGRADERQPTQEPAHHGAGEIFWPVKRSSDNSPGGYQSKHRQTGPAKQQPQRERERRAPRHAAPPARFSAR
jgi:hypothetical protein